MPSPGVGDDIGKTLQYSALSLANVGGENILLIFHPARLPEDDKERQVVRSLHLLVLDNVRLGVFLNGVVALLRYFQLFLGEADSVGSVLDSEGVEEETLR